MRTLSLIMDAAVDARLLRDNPCRGVKAPRGASRREPRFLTPAEVEQLAAALRAPYDLLVRFAAYTGLRWGEIGALHVADVDLLRRSVRVGRSLERDGSFKDTKTHTRRTVHLEPALAEELAAHLAGNIAASAGNRPAAAGNPSGNIVAAPGNMPGNPRLVWTSPLGGPLDYPRFRSRVWLPAVRASGLEPQPRFHDLRHTCASWLIARGGSPRAVMAWMGHSTIKVTFDRYGHLFPHELADLADGLADLRADPDAFGRSSTTTATVTPLDHRPRRRNT